MAPCRVWFSNVIEFEGEKKGRDTVAMINTSSQSTADLNDPVLSYHAKRITHVGRDAFFLALAAWQRGLQVRFLCRFQGYSERFAQRAVNPAVGELIGISDGNHEHFFWRTLGDKTPEDAVELSSNKPAAIAILAKAGIPVPEAVQSDTTQLAEGRGRDARLRIGVINGCCVGAHMLSPPLGSGEGEFTTEQLVAAAGEHALRACEVLGLPVADVDVAMDTVTSRLTVLDANPMLSLKRHAYADKGNPGNRVAEAIIDYYFPATSAAPRHRRASFDFISVCKMLGTGAVADLTLPVLAPHWRHHRITVAAAQLGEDNRTAIVRAVMGLGIHSQSLFKANGDLLLDVVTGEDQLSKFLHTLKPLFAVAS